MADPFQLIKASQDATAQYFSTINAGIVAKGAMRNNTLRNLQATTRTAADIAHNEASLAESIRYNTFRIDSAERASDRADQGLDLDRLQLELDQKNIDNAAKQERAKLEFDLIKEKARARRQDAKREIIRTGEFNSVSGLWEEQHEEYKEALDRGFGSGDLTEEERDGLIKASTTSAFGATRSIGPDIGGPDDALLAPEPDGTYDGAFEQLDEKSRLQGYKDYGGDELPFPDAGGDLPTEAEIDAEGRKGASGIGGYSGVMDFIAEVEEEEEKVAPVAKPTLRTEQAKIAEIYSWDNTDGLNSQVAVSIGRKSEPLMEARHTQLRAMDSISGSMGQISALAQESYKANGGDLNDLARMQVAISARNDLQSQISALDELDSKATANIIGGGANVSPEILAREKLKAAEIWNIRQKKSRQEAEHQRDIDAVLNENEPLSRKPLVDQPVNETPEERRNREAGERLSLNPSSGVYEVTDEDVSTTFSSSIANIASDMARQLPIPDINITSKDYEINDQFFGGRNYELNQRGKAKIFEEVRKNAKQVMRPTSEGGRGDEMRYILDNLDTHIQSRIDVLREATSFNEFPDELRVLEELRLKFNPRASVHSQTRVRPKSDIKRDKLGREIKSKKRRFSFQDTLDMYAIAEASFYTGMVQTGNFLDGVTTKNKVREAAEN